MKWFALRTVLGLVVASAALARPPAGSERPEFTSLLPKSAASGFVVVCDPEDVTYFGGTTWAADSMRWEAIQDSVWTFDTGVGSVIIEPGETYPFVNPYKPDGFHAYMEGWVGQDRTYSEAGFPYFRRVSDADPRWGGSVCVGSSAGLGGSYSFWAGVFQSEAADLCYQTGQGYGNSWNLCIQQSFPFSGGGATLQFDYVLETEPGFDFAQVFVSHSYNDEEILVTSYEGSALGQESIALPLSPRPGTVTVKFCLQSDGAWSDEDGLYDTVCGGFAVDDIVLTGGIVHSADFETDEDGWSIAPFAEGIGGEWTRLMALDDLPPPGVGNCSMADSVLVMFDPSTNDHSLFQSNLAVSPWIDLTGAGLTGLPGKFIELEGYFALSSLRYLFLRTEAQWYPDTCEVSGVVGLSDFEGTTWPVGSSAVCLSGGDFSSRFDLSGVIPAGAEQVRIAVGVVSFCRFFANCFETSNTTPWFDNIRFGVSSSPTFTTLQEAIDYAAEGDTICVPPGVHSGAGNRGISFGGKNLVLIGIEGPDSTIIDCEGMDRAFLIENGEDSTSVIEGFTIRNGVPPDSRGGGGVLVDSTSALTIRNCRITNCSVSPSSGYYGGGVRAGFRSRVILDRCEIVENAASWGGGIHVHWVGGELEATQCTISTNTATIDGGGIFFGGSGRVYDSVISGNRATRGGGVMGASGQFSCDADAILVNCTVEGNEASAGSGNGGGGSGGCVGMINCLVIRNISGASAGGILAGYAGNPIIGCVIEDNVAAGGAGGVYVGNTHVIDCRISGNVAEFGGGIIASSGWLGKAVVTGCEIVGNQAVRGGGVMGLRSGFGSPIDLNLSNSTVAGNYASEEGGGILANTDFNTILSRTILWNNCADGSGGELWLADSTSTVEFFCSAVDTTGIEGPGLATFDGNMVFEHPRFCSPVSCAFAPSADGDYTLSASSPCLPGFSPCDSLIGALGEGCAITDVPREEKPTRPGPMMSIYPNPFVNSVNIGFAVGEEAAQIHIHDVAGRLIRQFKRLQGDGNLVWDGLDRSGRSVPAGIYFVTLKLPSTTISRRAVLLR